MTQCVRCGSQLGDGAYVCQADTQTLADALLVAAGHAEDAATPGSGARLSPARGSGETPMPDLTRARIYARAAAAITSWAQIAIDETGRRPRWRPAIGPLCPPLGARCMHGSCEAIRRQTPPDTVALAAAWLAQQAGWLRKHPAAADAFDELHGACTDLARLVDVPPDKDLVGMCDCGRVLYAIHGTAYVTCPQPTCKLRWNVAESRDILRTALDGKLVTAATAARLGQYLDSDRTQDAIRKLIASRVRAGQLLSPGVIHDEPAYRFGDISMMLATVQRRERRAAA